MFFLDLDRCAAAGERDPLIGLNLVAVYRTFHKEMAAGLMTVKVVIKIKDNIASFGNGKRTDYITIFILKIGGAILRQLKSIGQLVGQRCGTLRQVIGDGKVVGKANRAAILDSQVKILELAVILYLILRAVNLNCDVCDPVIGQRGSKTRRCQAS